MKKETNAQGRAGRSPLTPEGVLEALKPVQDPELGYSLVDLGLIRGIELLPGHGSVLVRLTLTSPACPMAEEIVEAVEEALLGIPGVELGEVELVWSPPWDPRTDPTEEIKADFGIWD